MAITLLAGACSQRSGGHATLGLAVDASPAVAVAGAPSPTPLSEADRRDKDIALYAAAVQLDPFSAHLHAQLALRYLQRGRERASQVDVTSAESEARASLAQRTQNNGAAFATLLEALMEQHRFVEAGRVGRQLVAGNPDEPVYLAMLGEIESEIGNYDEASRAFAAIATQRQSLGISMRLARFAELRGDTTRARTAFYRAVATSALETTMPSEQRAWFHLRVGDYELRHGNLAAADRAYQRGLTISPRDHRLLSGIARLHAVQQHWREAIVFGDQAIAIAMDPATVGLVGDAYASLGDTTTAQQYFRAMEVAVPREAGAYHRAWSLHLLDHGSRYADVYTNVRTELRTRHDIFGYDLLGWALYKQGRYGEARLALQRALAQGTQDAGFFFHAGMIERALGNRDAAQQLLTRALAINPHFDPSHPAMVRATIDSLSRERVQVSAR